MLCLDPFSSQLFVFTNKRRNKIKILAWDKTGFILLIAVIGKVIHEQVNGASDSVASLISANVAIDAHLWGMFGGAMIGLVSLIRYYKSGKV